MQSLETKSSRPRPKYLEAETDLRRPSETFGDLRRPSETFGDLRRPSETFGDLRRPLETFETWDRDSKKRVSRHVSRPRPRPSLETHHWYWASWLLTNVFAYPGVLFLTWVKNQISSTNCIFSSLLQHGIGKQNDQELHKIVERTFAV